MISVLSAHAVITDGVQPVTARTPNETLIGPNCIPRERGVRYTMMTYYARLWYCNRYVVSHQACTWGRQGYLRKTGRVVSHHQNEIPIVIRTVSVEFLVILSDEQREAHVITIRERLLFAHKQHAAGLLDANAFYFSVEVLEADSGSSPYGSLANSAIMVPGAAPAQTAPSVVNATPTRKKKRIKILIQLNWKGNNVGLNWGNNGRAVGGPVVALYKAKKGD
ncbi:hypothetical protein BU17DRAFT_69054 [Hysterangium stoloniferum]|nr:hypothetical protein BU17DRAFT_69054 [Hysterangium stoloniferum]